MTSYRKLLVAIQDDKASEMLCFHLEEEGFEVEPYRKHCGPMPSDEKTLCEILVATTKQLRAHFLIIEYSLLRDMDKSTLRTLSDDIFPTHCIFLTPDQIAPSDAMRIIKTESGLIAHEQAGGKNHLFSVIDEEYALPTLEFEDKESALVISKVAKSLRVEAGIEVQEDEINHLLEYLCLRQGYETLPTNIEIRLRPATQAIRESLAHEKRTMRAVALLLEIDGRYPLILKFASRNKIKREVQGYKRIQGFIASLRHARIESSVLGWYSGGLIYTLVGASTNNRRQPPMTFGEFYNSKSVENYKDIENILKNLFSQTLKFALLHDNHNSDLQTQSFFYGYSSTWGENFVDRLEQKIGDSVKHLSNIVTVLGLKEDELENPVTWALKNRGVKLLGFETATTHGDLNVGNVLIDQQGECWLIDFERSGEGHIHRDFVEFECDIFVRLVDTGLNQALYDIACLMVSWEKFPRSTSETPYTRELINNSHTLKFFYTMRYLRVLTEEENVKDARAYYWGLLMNALFCYEHYAQDEQRRTRSFLLASVIATRLENWTRSRSAPEWRTESWDQTLPEEMDNKTSADEKTLYVALQKLTRNELGSLCFNLGHSSDEFASDSDPKEKLARSLIEYYAHRERLARLLEQIKKQYPHILRS